MPADIIVEWIGNRTDRTDRTELNGRFNSGNFLKVKKRMERKKPENNHAVKNKKGELVTENGEILRCYEEYFSDLLTKTNEH